MSGEPLDAFLAAPDLDALAAAYDALPDQVDTARTGAVVRSWSDPRAVSHLLLHPRLLPDDLRADALLRGLRSEGYPRLAATVGVGWLSATELKDDVRHALLDALLDVVASDAGPAGVRAAAEVGPLLGTDDLELLDDLAGHPVDAVRHNLEQARLGVVDPGARRPVLLPRLPDYDAGLRPST